MLTLRQKDRGFSLARDAPKLLSIPRRQASLRSIGAGCSHIARANAAGSQSKQGWYTSRVERTIERGRAVAAELKRLGAKRILIRAAEQGYITQLACKMPECFCPEELGGACYFERVTPELSDWMPTLEHFPISKREGGKKGVENAILAHRLCNRIDYSISVGRSYASDLKRISKAREDAIRRNNEGPDALARI